MIAMIRFPGGTATLGDDAVWAAPGPHGDALNAMLSVEDRSPARGDWPREHATRMAEMLGGRVEFGEKAESPPGRIY